MDLMKMECIIESILFASGEAIPLARLAYAIDLDVKTTKKLINKLKDSYDSNNRGIQIIEVEGSYQMCTRSDYYEYIKVLLKTPKRFTLTEAQLETLSIIAYKQPVTKSQIESIRGVRCNHVINKLIEYNLICEKGRLTAPGKPLLFGTTEEFLKHFGLTNTGELPEIREEVIQELQNEVAVELERELEEKEDTEDTSKM